MSTTFDKVAEIIAETCDIPRENIKPESHAINDLEIDSLDFLDIAFAIDKAFGIKLPLEQWTQEVNDGKATTDQYFVLKNLSDADRPADRGQGRLRRPRMRLEYFQMIDRIAALDLGEREVRAVRPGAARKHDIRGAFPVLSADARRAADRMHGANRRLAGERARRVYRNADPGRRQGGEVPHRRAARRRARIRRQGCARGFGLLGRRMQGVAPRQGCLRGSAHLSHDTLPHPGIPRRPCGNGRNGINVPVKTWSRSSRSD